MNFGVKGPDEWILQWYLVLNQIAVMIPRPYCLKEGLQNYVYPHDLPNLTKDYTDKIDINWEEGVLWNKEHREEVRMLWRIMSWDGEYLFDIKFVACPDGTVLKFD